MLYAEQEASRKIESLLPEEYRFTEEFHPAEEWWSWRENDIHLDTFRNPQAKAKVLLLHGVGTNGRQLSSIVGGPLAKDGFEVIALDMPLYGMTVVRQKKPVSYDEWVRIGSEYVDFEAARDPRPIFLYGLSAGGMETYHIACENRNVRGIVGMTFLDQRDQQVRDETANNAFWAHAGTPLATLSVKLGLGGFHMKMSTCSKMSALCNDPACLDVMLKDRTSAGNSVPMTFIDSYMNAAPTVEPEEFDVCPILLTQPSNDRWTPLRLSEPFLARIEKVPVTIVELENGGHYPVEREALSQLHERIRQFIQAVCAEPAPPSHRTC